MSAPEPMPVFTAQGPFGRAVVSEKRKTASSYIMRAPIIGVQANESDEFEGWAVQMDGCQDIELCESKDAAIQRARVMAGTIVLR